MSQILDENFIDKTILTSIKSLGNYAKFYKKHCNEFQPGQETYDDFKSLVERYCEIDNENKMTTQALKKTFQHFTSPNACNQDLSIEEVLDKKLQESVVTEAIDKNKYMVSYFNAVRDNEDLSIVENFQPPIDPITKVVIKNPVRNTKCGHIYDKESIRPYLSKTKCPYIGCPVQEKLSQKCIVEDEDLKKRIVDYLRRTKDS